MDDPRRDDGNDRRPLPPFPPEAGWLELEPPPVGDDFVGRTLARLKHVGLVGAGDDTADLEATGLDPADDDSGQQLRPDLLAQLRAPTPSRAFVDRTLARVTRDRADAWSRLLLRYDAPEPTPDFVARTLRALAPLPARAGGRLRRLALVLLPLAAAAALLLLLRPQREAWALRDYVATSIATTTAPAQSPALLSHLLAAAAATPRANAELPVLPPDGAWLWLAAAEGRR